MACACAREREGQVVVVVLALWSNVVRRRIFESSCGCWNEDLICEDEVSVASGGGAMVVCLLFGWWIVSVVLVCVQH